MTDTESDLTTLAEVATREISQNEDPASLQHSINMAHRGGKVAKVAREALEDQFGPFLRRGVQVLINALFISNP